MYCRNCGTELNGQRYCIRCGYDSMQNNYSQNNIKKDESSIGLNIVGIIWPIIGFIIYICIKKDEPIKAKGVGICSLISFIIRIALIIVMIILAFLAYQTAVNNSDYYDNNWYDYYDYDDSDEESIYYFKDKIDNYVLLATKQFYEDTIKNPDLKTICYSISDLTTDTDYKGSIQLIKENNDLNITIWITNYEYVVDGINYDKFSINDIERGFDVSTSCKVTNNNSI